MSKSEWRRVTVDEASAMFRDNPVAMLKEYGRMRDIERKRMNRIQESTYAWTETARRERSKAYTQMDSRDFAKAYSELSKFLSAKTSTLGGQRARERKLSTSEIKANIAYWAENNTGQRLYVRKGRKLKSSSDDF